MKVLQILIQILSEYEFMFYGAIVKFQRDYLLFSQHQKSQYVSLISGIRIEKLLAHTPNTLDSNILVHICRLGIN